MLSLNVLSFGSRFIFFSFGWFVLVVLVLLLLFFFEIKTKDGTQIVGTTEKSLSARTWTKIRNNQMPSAALVKTFLAKSL